MLTYVTAVVAHGLMVTGYITVVKNITNFVDKKIETKKA